MEEFPEGYFDPLPILIPEVIDVEDEPEPELTEEEIEFQKKRDKAQRCKIIALSSMGCIKPYYKCKRIAFPRIMFHDTTIV